MSKFWLFTATPMEIIIIILAGFLGGLCKTLLKDRILLFPRRTPQGVYLGFFADLILGVSVAFILDGHPITAFSVAVAAPTIIEDLLRKIKKGIKNASAEN